MDERELVSAASRGDATAVDELLAQHLPGMRAFIRLRMGPVLRARESCSDLAQSVCREVLQHIDRFQYPGKSGFKHWLYATALRKIANRAEFHQAAKRDVAREFRPDETRDAHLSRVYDSLCTPSQDVIAKEQIEHLEQAFDHLPDDYREVIVLARVVGLTRSEIGKEMGKSEGAVRTLLHRALLQLAEHLHTSE